MSFLGFLCLQTVSWASAIFFLLLFEWTLVGTWIYKLWTLYQQTSLSSFVSFNTTLFCEAERGVRTVKKSGVGPVIALGHIRTVGFLCGESRAVQHSWTNCYLVVCSSSVSTSPGDSISASESGRSRYIIQSLGWAVNWNSPKKGHLKCFAMSQTPFWIGQCITISPHNECFVCCSHQASSTLLYF